VTLSNRWTKDMCRSRKLVGCTVSDKHSASSPICLSFFAPVFVCDGDRGSYTHTHTHTNTHTHESWTFVVKTYSNKKLQVFQTASEETVDTWVTVIKVFESHK
jgi:hypothetical protein